MARVGTARGAVPDRGDQGGRSADRRWPAWGALALLALASPTAAAEPFSADFRHTVLARRALLQDPQVASLNLGVKVHNRVVTMWGSVPSGELAKRAENVLRSLPDFRQVRSELYIDGSDLAVSPAAVPFLPPMATEKAGEQLPVIGQIWLPAGSVLPEKPAPLSVRRAFNSTGVLTRHWEPLLIPAAQPTSSPNQITAAAPEVSDSAPKALEHTIRELQRSKEAFRHIDVSVQGGLVTVRGPAHLDATHELARLIARLPGVGRVVLRE